jgi:hypothetical protein
LSGSIPTDTIARYTDSFFALRREVDPLLDGEEPPRLVVYAPLSEVATQDALIELTAVGVVLKPDQQPWQRNTRLSVMAKATLKDALGAEQAQRIGKQVNEGQLTLADLDRVAERTSGGEAHGVIAVIFGSGSPEEVALALLAGNAQDAEIAAKRAQAGVAFSIALYSAIKERSARSALVVLGELTIQGNILPARSLAEPLQAAMDNGAKRALIPVENKRSFLEVASDVVERVDPIFYGEPLAAALKALGAE